MWFHKKMLLFACVLTVVSASGCSRLNFFEKFPPLGSPGNTPAPQAPAEAKNEPAANQPAPETVATAPTPDVPPVASAPKPEVPRLASAPKPEVPRLASAPTPDAPRLASAPTPGSPAPKIAKAPAHPIDPQTPITPIQPPMKPQPAYNPPVVPEKDPEPAPEPANAPEIAPAKHVPDCGKEEHVQPAAPPKRSLDILFVNDTSGSLKKMRSRIVKNIGSFVAQIPSDVDFQIGVLLAHGSNSKWSGRLYSPTLKNGVQKPVVLTPARMSAIDLRRELESYLNHAPLDNMSGGEEAFFSLNRAIEGKHLEYNRAKGFFRPGATLAVIFVSDENELCYIDRPPNAYPYTKAHPFSSPDEKRAYKRDCAGVTPANTLERIVKLQDGAPYSISALVMTKLWSRTFISEQEHGYGYLELVGLAGQSGLSIDLESKDYREGLEMIGRLTSNNMTVKHDFLIHMNDVDESSITVKVDGSPAGYAYDSKRHEVHVPNPGTFSSTIQISYCAPSD